MKIRTRFCPSPTGRIHLGNARTALFSALYALANHGALVLRIEDTDAERSEEQHVDALKHDMIWIDLTWQEGPDVGGEYGPYWQSQRQDIYDQYYKILEEKKQIYPCFCTDQELMIARKLQISRGLAPRYSGTCKQLTQEEIQERINNGKKSAWRFSVPVNEKIEFIDVVKGLQSFQSDDMGDFIVRRTDGTAPFLFCNAVDDALMKISHVLRGEDHLTNTPRQIMILNALGLSIPHYGHLSLIVGDDGAPLSKRHGSFSIEEMRNQGFLPLAIVNYLGRLGHTSDSQVLLDMKHLAEHFHLDKLSRSPARFDRSQLMYWQKLAVQQLSVDAFWHWVGDAIKDQVPEPQKNLFVQTVKANIEFPQDAMHWVNIFFNDDIEIERNDKTVIQEAGEKFFVEAEQAVDKYGIQFQNVLADMKQTLGLTGKKLFMPLRLALTGQAHGPELIHIAELLGQDKMKKRLGRAFKQACN
jgi:glutamyl-tRNA synthetase